MTYEEYADALNAHAEGCQQCAFSKKMGTTHSVCADGQKIIDDWKASPKTDEDEFWMQMNALARELKDAEETEELERTQDESPAN